jgi:hypothetical protein
LSKRIQKKRTREVCGWIADSVRLFVSRPRGGPKPEAYEALALDMLKFNVGIALALLHQWYPSARAGVWIKETGRPEVTYSDDGRFEAAGTLVYARTADDVELAAARYELSARAGRRRWSVVSLRVIGPTELISRAAT